MYWKTVFQALEDRFECWLLNAHHLRNVPGRKTDVKDSEWICQLVQHGLVRPSFVPPPEIRRLRDLTRLRKAQINERARSIQRLEKVLQDAGHQAHKRRVDHLLEVRARDARSAAVPGSPIPSSSPSSPRPGCARRSRSCARRSRAASRSSTTASWSPSCSRTSTRSTPRSRTSTERIELVLAPHAADGRAVVHDPRRSDARRAGPDRRVRPRHDAVPDGRALRLLGRRVPRPSRIGRPPALGTNPARAALADRPR